MGVKRFVKQLTKLIPLYFAGLVVLPFLYKGTISDVHNIFGKYPVEINTLNKVCKNGDRMSLNTIKY
jgi:hypothetical protein